MPSGYFDRSVGQWVPSVSGRIVRVVNIRDGQAALDVDGDGLEDHGEALSILGIDSDELTVLGGRYEVGASLWRIPLEHFSAWDFNWCFMAGLSASLPPDFFPSLFPDSCMVSGSIIECENQVLGESFKLAGVPYDLYYRSDRVIGRRDAFHFEVPLTDEVPPVNAKRIRFELEILGQHISHVVDALPNQTFAFDWDGKDGYGRLWQGSAPIRFRIGYVYDGWYTHTPVFGASGEIDRTRWDRVPNNGEPQPSGFTAEDDLARLETTLWSGWQSSTLGTFQAAGQGLGGLTLGVHHTYHPTAHILYWNGRPTSSDPLRLRRQGRAWCREGQDDGRDARHTAIEGPHGIAIAPDGSAYVSLEHQHRIVKLTRDGIVTTIAGTGVPGFTGDRDQALRATLNEPLGLAFAQDGSLYITERVNKVVRKISRDGTIEILRWCSGGQRRRYSEAGQVGIFCEPHAVAVGSEGSLYIADALRHNVRRLRTDGMLEMFAGNAPESPETWEMADPRRRPSCAHRCRWRWVLTAASTSQKAKGTALDASRRRAVSVPLRERVWPDTTVTGTKPVLPYSTCRTRWTSAVTALCTSPMRVTVWYARFLLEA